MLDQIKEIKRRVDEEGVSRSLVTSFESLVGANVVTKQININKFTANNSCILKEEFCAVLDPMISELEKPKVALSHTALDVLNLCKDYSYKLETLVKNLKICTQISKDVWDRIFNEKYAVRYGDDEDFINVALGFSVYRSLHCGNDYLSAILNMQDNKDTQWKFERIKNILNKLETNYDWDMLQQGYYPLLNTLLSKSFPSTWYQGYKGQLPNIDYINMDSMYSIFVRDAETIIESVQYVQSSITRMKDDYYRGSRNFDISSHQDADKVYHNLMNIKHLLEDEVSISLIEIFTHLANDKN